ncbi:MAG: ASCH domain-containing protein [Tuberibacillus sp.]
MNEAALAYWNAYWKGKKAPERVSAWQFGADPDELARLVVEGVKTATCSAYILYELENEPLPTTEDYSIILNSKDEPVAIIKTVDVAITPMNQVNEAFAIAEGEGDRTYEYWWAAHVKFFTEALNEVGYKFTEDLLLVCERFVLIDKKVF